MVVNYEVTPVRRLLSNVISHHTVLSHDMTINPQNFLRDIRGTVIPFIRERPENKVCLILVCEMERTNPATGEVVQTEESYFRTLQEPVYSSTDLETMYERMSTKMLEAFSAYLKNGSRWTLKRVLKLNITFSKNKPVKGSSYILLPKGLRGTGCLINVQNKKDHYCFVWSILRELHPRENNKHRIEDLKEYFNELNLDGIEFPTLFSERTFKKSEKNNDISLLVFGH